MDPRRSTVLNCLGYHAWASQQILDSVEPLNQEELHRDMQASHSSVWGTLEHCYKADQVWLSRFKGVATAKLSDYDAPEDLATLRGEWADVQTELSEWAESRPDDAWTHMMDYRLMNGTECSSPVYENLLHVVNHGTFHRGQVVTMLRQLGASPIPTDFVLYVRTAMQSGF